MGFFQGIQKRGRNSRGKRAISVQATEGLLYISGDSLDQHAHPRSLVRDITVRKDHGRTQRRLYSISTQ